MKKCLSLLVISIFLLNFTFAQTADPNVTAAFNKYFKALETGNHSKRLDTYDPNIFTYVSREFLDDAYRKKADQSDQKLSYSSAKINKIGKPVRGNNTVYHVVDYSYKETITVKQKEGKKNKVEPIQDNPEVPLQASDMKNPEDQKRFKQLQKRQKKAGTVAPVSEPEKPKTLSPFEAKVVAYENQFGADNVIVEEKAQEIIIKKTAKLITVGKGNKMKVIEFSNDMIPLIKKIIPAETLGKLGSS